MASPAENLSIRFHLTLADIGANTNVDATLSAPRAMYGQVTSYTLPVLTERLIELPPDIDGIPYVKGGLEPITMSFVTNNRNPHMAGLIGQEVRCTLYGELSNGNFGVADGVAHAARIEGEVTIRDGGSPAPNVPGETTVTIRATKNYGEWAVRTPLTKPTAGGANNCILYVDLEAGERWHGTVDVNAPIRTALFG